jgi:hypothetical protein
MNMRDRNVAIATPSKKNLIAHFNILISPVTDSFAIKDQGCRADTEWSAAALVQADHKLYEDLASAFLDLLCLTS